MTDAQCPVNHDKALPQGGRRSHRDWWPDQLNLSVLHPEPSSANPLGEDFDYARAFAEVDLAELEADVVSVMTTSQEFWPADYGHYGPLFIRMAWHSAGTYRISDGRGGAGAGAQRFAPINSWPDNANLDKARRLLWPVKQKWGRSVSWADLLVFAGTIALKHMGLPLFGFSGGREDIWAPQEDTYWGSEDVWLGDERYHGDRELENPLAAVQMGLIYVNPEGPNGTPDPAASARDIRETFARMAMNDEETVALIAGGHTFGKTHGNAPAEGVGPEPEAAPLEQMGLGWKNSKGTGVGPDAITSGLEGAWTPTPTTWDSSYFDVLFGHEWEKTHSPAGVVQWIPKDGAATDSVPDPFDAQRRHAPVMLTTDLALRVDPVYEEICRRFHADPIAYADAFARAWFKLTHRDMGPKARYVGAWTPAEDLIWQDPVPVPRGPLVTEEDQGTLNQMVLASGLEPVDLVFVAWASAATFRGTDKRGGANGARIRLTPQRQWAANEPELLDRVLPVLEQIASEFNSSSPRQISLADLIVLAGNAGVKEAARRGGHEVTLSFTPGRGDATPEMTDAESFAVLEPVADGFRNYARADLAPRAEKLLVEKATLLNLSAPEMTALVGGLRALGVVPRGTTHGVFTERPGSLSTDFFRVVTSMDLEWRESGEGEYVGVERGSGRVKWTATRADLVFGSNSQLRALSEVYASRDGVELFVQTFARAWGKVMESDRFGIA
ncbi:MAG: catalase/peroxidase HPI [Acidimicrobiaceae bacterium]|nr:catalase/peroxidase HPI [Acidimicrobiaceae bacterium]